MPASSVLQPEPVPSAPATTSGFESPQLQEDQEHPVTADDVNFVMDICARVEAETVVCRRMALRSLKKRRNQGGNLSRTFDIEADLEKSLHLVECLPQGSRGADPPCEEFLRLSRAVSGTNASPHRILENALLLEEYALQLLSASDSQYESQHNRRTASPWLILSDVEQRIPAQSEVALSQPDGWLTGRICKLLGAAPGRGQRNRVQSRSGRPQMRENQSRRRCRKRRRKELTRAECDPVADSKEGGSDYYSSDNYSDTSDEQEEEDKVKTGFGGD